VGEITPDVIDDFLGLTVRTAEVVHFSGAPSTAVRLSDGTRTLAYSGDTQWTDTLIKIADGADLFICECYDYARDLTGHMSWPLLQAKRPVLNAKKIMITHMNPTMLAKTGEARAAGVLVAEDGLVVDV
jgi:ribonuclease BN (tRNA processing enzyme)